MSPRDVSHATPGDGNLHGRWAGMDWRGFLLGSGTSLSRAVRPQLLDIRTHRTPVWNKAAARMSDNEGAVDAPVPLQPRRTRYASRLGSRSRGAAPSAQAVAARDTRGAFAVRSGLASNGVRAARRGVLRARERSAGGPRRAESVSRDRGAREHLGARQRHTAR